jgi:hypothetical protein
MVGRLYAAVVCIGVLGWGGLAIAQGPLSTPVFAATLENQRFDHERNEISFDLVNNTTKPITMYDFWVIGTGPDGTEHLCFGMGQDMIDWSGPPPGINQPASWTEGWIKPNERQRVVRSAESCLSHMPSVMEARAQLDMVLFDDGTGDGNPDEMAFHLLKRRYERDEMTKWAPRFTALLKDPGFGNLASQLYRDLVQASHDGELNPDIAGSNRGRSAQAVRNELKGIALEIREYSKTGKNLSDSAYLRWQIETLQKRTERLVRGSGAETESDRNE